MAIEMVAWNEVFKRHHSNRRKDTCFGSHHTASPFIASPFFSEHRGIGSPRGPLVSMVVRGTYPQGDLRRLHRLLDDREQVLT